MTDDSNFKTKTGCYQDQAMKTANALH